LSALRTAAAAASWPSYMASIISADGPGIEIDIAVD
jgi:hypothetical protein